MNKYETTIPRIMLYHVMRWLFAWATLLDALIGIATIGIWLPSLSLRAAKAGMRVRLRPVAAAAEAAKGEK